MKRLPPPLREDHRYLKFRIYSEEKIEIGDVVEEIWDTSLSYLGSKGCSKANFWVIGNLFEEEDQEGIIRVNRDMEEELRAAISLIDRFNNDRGFIKVLKVSGSIKSLKNS